LVPLKKAAAEIDKRFFEICWNRQTA